MNKPQQTITEIGLKRTPTRMALLALLHKVSKPLDADTIFALLKQKGIKTDRVTVYRTLNTLTEYEILRKVELGEGKSRFELAQLPHHHHLICTGCDKIVDIYECGMEKVKTNLEKRTSFLVTQHNAEFFGICTDCQ